MAHRILQYLDFERVNTLLEGFNQSTGFVTAILDLEGNVLSRSGWRSICTDFHRVNPGTAARCRESDTVLSAGAAEGSGFHFYKCLNGLVDVAVPVVVGGVHIANLFTGQFFFEKPDIDLFREQAARFGFDEKSYLQALARVPVVPREGAEKVLRFLLNMTHMIGEMTFQRIELMEANENLVRSESRYHLLFENMLEAMAYHRIIFEEGKAVDYVYIEVNDAFEKQTGLRDVVGKRVTELVPGIRESNPELLERFGRVALTGIPESYEIHVKATNEWYYTSLYSFLDDIVVSVFENISARKRAEEDLKQLNLDLERRVEERTARLGELNSELEKFTYSVSHDLKAPLRGIDGYSKLLIDLYSERLNEEGLEFLAEIRKSAGRMDQLIDDLLEYSKLEKTEVRKTWIHISDFFKSLSAAFEQELKEAQVRLELSVPDIRVFADYHGLMISVRNIMDNAIKFTRGVESPEVKVNVDTVDGGWRISVKDNGIGFNMKYHDRIFEIFQRLNRTEDYPGTGIGLAMVSKAVQRMNGRVWAVSEQGKGSEFIIELPGKTYDE